MLDPRYILHFAARFVVIFGLLVLPWPHFQEAFAIGYRSGAHTLLVLALPHSLITVEPHHEPRHLSVDTKISIGEPQERPTDGLLPVKRITQDSRSLGWMPLAMFIALWGATPLNWTQRWKTLAIGVGGILLFIAATILTSVCPAIFTKESWKHFLAIAANHLLVENLWLSFVGPVLIWLGCILWFYPRNNQDGINHGDSSASYSP